MSISRTVTEHIAFAILYWSACWLIGLLCLMAAMLHSLALFILVTTASAPNRLRYGLALLGVLFVACTGFGMFLYLTDISD